MKTKTPFFAVLAATVIAFSACDQQAQQPARTISNDANSHVIPISLAREYTKRFRDNLATMGTLSNNSAYLQSNFHMSYAEMFPRDVYEVLLAQKDSKGNLAAGIRTYNGINEKGEVVLVMVPYDQENKDIINKLSQAVTIKVSGGTTTNAQASEEGEAMEVGQKCPPVCDNGGSGL